ncbi:MAG: hypothetical protein ACK55Z_23160, partial [bacterium]
MPAFDTPRPYAATEHPERWRLSEVDLRPPDVSLYGCGHAAAGNDRTVDFSLIHGQETKLSRQRPPPGRHAH